MTLDLPGAVEVKRARVFVRHMLITSPKGSFPALEVPQPGEPATPVVPDAPVTPIDPDPGTPADPEQPAEVPAPEEPDTPIVPEPRPER